ncbi:hypothetical protein G7046_g6321 [Stylonectria norvegica]|nr:hypothetical protein G7046_g6321 [Stylonectria norvegica]
MVKSVLITGCSEGGIGDFLAREFHSRGFKVFASARNLQKILHLKKIGISTIELDVTSTESVRQAAQKVEDATNGTLDILVNNAGSAYSMPVLDTDIGVAKDMFEVNLFGPLRVVQLFSPLLIAARGKVVNMSSIVGEFPNSFTGAYNASKAGLSILADNMRIELEPLGVKVITVVAGTVNTNLVTNQAHSKLPESSRYFPIKAKVEYILDGNELTKGAMDPKLFAEKVADNAVKGNPTARHWLGTSASLIWVMTTFFKHTFLDGKLSKDSGLTELKVAKPKN